MKVEDYLAGAIHRTPNGNFVYIEGSKHAGEFASLDALKRVVGRQAVIAPGTIVKAKMNSKRGK